jgi:hypothetical protein
MSIDTFHEEPDLEVNLQDFIEENGFVKVGGERYECPLGFFWTEDEIHNHAMDCQNENVRNNI